MTTTNRMMTLDRLVHQLPVNLQVPMREIILWIDEDTRVSREDFSELKATVERSAIVLEVTGHRLDELTVKVENLAEAQERLTEAQARTEAKVEQLAEAQARTEAKVEHLAEQVDKLAAAQTRTEAKVEHLAGQVDKLAAAQTRTEYALQELKKSLSDQIASLGSRWGIYNEGTFRATIYGVFQRMEGITVKEGWYGDRQVDVVIRDGEHILLEITSRMHAKDIDRLYQSAQDYEQREGIRPILMVATSYVSPKLMQKIMGLDRPIEIFSYEGEE